MTPHKPPRRAVKFLESRQLGVAWIVAVSVGALIISSNTSVTPQRLVIPVLIMLGYGAFVFNRWSRLFATASQAYKLSIVGQLADSMYFMGFVWTLWALIDSFVIHQIDTADAIFRTFGYALVTTAVGMFCRLSILQFKYTATEQTQEAEESIEEILVKFGASLQVAHKVLEAWHTTLDAATASIGTSNAGLIAAIEQTRSETTNTITAATRSWVAMLTTIQSRLESLLQHTGSDLKAALQEGVVDGLSDFGRQTSTNLDQVREATTGLVATLKRTNTGLGKSIMDLTEKVNEITAQVGAVPSTLASCSRQIHTTLDEMTKALNASVAAWTTAIDNSRNSIASATAAITREMTGLATEIKREITLGLEGITVTPHVAVTVDDGILHNAITPLRDGLQHVAKQAGNIQEALNVRLPHTPPSTDDVVQGVDRVLQAAVGTILGRLELVEKDVQYLRALAPQAEQSERSMLDRLLRRR
jgi:prefoldin subunit 5